MQFCEFILPTVFRGDEYWLENLTGERGKDRDTGRPALALFLGHFENNGEYIYESVRSRGHRVQFLWTSSIISHAFATSTKLDSGRPRMSRAHFARGPESKKLVPALVDGQNRIPIGAHPPYKVPFTHNYLFVAVRAAIFKNILRSNTFLFIKDETPRRCFSRFVAMKWSDATLKKSFELKSTEKEYYCLLLCVS